MKKLRLISLTFIFMFSMLLSACGTDNNENKKEEGKSSGNQEKVELGQKKLSLPYVPWANTIASVNLMKAVLEDVGYDIDLKQVEAGVLFSSIADGTGDFSVGAVTLPTTHKDYWKKYKDQLVDVGISIKKSTTLGLVVPSYVDIDSIEDLKNNKNGIGDKVDWKIIGIDPGAGEMQLAKDEVMPGYGLDEKWELIDSSDAAMTAELKKAIDAHDPVIVTLWEPHWAFLEWDIKYLDDPDNLFGEPDDQHTVAREGLKEDAPAAYKVLDQFHWTLDDIGEVMLDTHNGMDAEKAAQKWIKNNQDKVDKWTKGIE